MSYQSIYYTDSSTPQIYLTLAIILNTINVRNIEKTRNIKTECNYLCHLLDNDNPHSVNWHASVSTFIVGRNFTINGTESIWIFLQAVQFLCGFLTSDMFLMDEWSAFSLFTSSEMKVLKFSWHGGWELHSTGLRCHVDV